MTAAKAGKKEAVENTAPVRERAVEAALRLAQVQGWDQVTLREIADEAELSYATLYAHFMDKTDILVALGRMIDQQVLEGMADISSDASVRDTLFDILMDRYDALNDHRDGIVAILKSFHLDPKQAVISFPHLCRSMSWMLEAANINTNGLRGAVKVTGLTVIYLRVLRVWMKDDSPDLSKTMAALDKTLGKAEQFANSFNL